MSKKAPEIPVSFLLFTAIAARLGTAGTGHGAALTGTAAAAFSLFLIPDHTGNDQHNDHSQHTQYDDITHVRVTPFFCYTPIFTLVSAYLFLRKIRYIRTASAITATTVKMLNTASPVNSPAS